MPSTLLKQHTMYAEWVTESGRRVKRLPQTFPVQFDVNELSAMWEWRRRYETAEEFLTLLHKITGTTAGNLGVNFCRDCKAPGTQFRSFNDVQGRTQNVCSRCWRDNRYGRCGRCRYFKQLHTAREDDQGRVCCSDCIAVMTLCRSCKVYHEPNRADWHAHDCCAPPLLEFTVPNGTERLAQNTRVRISLPSGQIDQEGMERIAVYLVGAGHDDTMVREALEACGPQSQTNKGNFSRRLSNAMYQRGVTLHSNYLSGCGTIAGQHAELVDHEIEVTRDLNGTAKEFGHESSCWWTSESRARCALKSNGGFGVRTFENDQVTGRCWVFPLRVDKPSKHRECGVGGCRDCPTVTTSALKPTFDTTTASGYLVFNGYGALTGFKAARIMAAMAGMSYQPMPSVQIPPYYVNGGSGYLVGPQDLLAAHKSGTLQMNMDQHSNLYQEELVQLQRAAQAQTLQTEIPLAVINLTGVNNYVLAV